MSTMWPTEYLAECFWPGVQEAELHALDERVRVSAADVSAEGRPVRYLGSLLVRADEVVLCRFEGTAEAVRETAERAQIPFERILETARSPWSHGEGDVDPDRDTGESTSRGTRATSPAGATNPDG